VAVDEWDGHVFVHVGEPTPTLADQLGALPAKFRAWGMRDLKLAARHHYDVAANWKLIVQNYSECLHCPAIHPALCKLSHHTSGLNEPFNSSYMGGFMELRPEVDTMSIDGRLRRAPLPGLSKDDLRRVYYYAIFPNLLLSLHPDYMMVHALSPTRVDATRVITEWHFHPHTMAATDFDPVDAVEFWDMTNRQDWMVCEQSQIGIRSPAYRPGPYSSREELLYGFDRLVLELLG
jgi:glycine betaine catabolism A